MDQFSLLGYHKIVWTDKKLSKKLIVDFFFYHISIQLPPSKLPTKMSMVGILYSMISLVIVNFNQI